MRNPLLKLSDKERIEHILKHRWLVYPRAEQILKKLEELLVNTKNMPRITSILIVGHSTNGKTSIVNRFAELHPRYDYNIERPANLPNDFFETHTGVGIPVLSIVAPSEPNESRLYTQILHAISVPYKERDTIARKQYLVEYYLKLLNVEMLIIDEIHNVLSGSIAKQKQILNAIKNITNTINIPVVLVGTKDALVTFNTDAQIESRFTPMYLPRWQFDDETASLLATYQQTLPLKKEYSLIDDDIVDEILDLTGGYIGQIFELLRQAAIAAIDNGTERITIRELRECSYVSQKERKRDEILELL